jgi:hypothetical protein
VKYQKERKAFSREERQHMIIQAFLVAKTHDVTELTLTDIAHSLKITASTKLRDIVTEMVIAGEIIDRKENIPGIAKFRRLYTLASIHAQEIHEGEQKQRTVTFKARKNGQQALWTEVIS